MKNFTLHLILIFSIIIGANAQNCVVLDLPFSGNTNDISGNGFHASNNGATLTEDRFGRSNSAYKFDGVNDYIVVAHDDLFSFNYNEDFTISLWVKADPIQATIFVTRNSVIEKWVDSNNASNAGYPYVIRYLNQTAPLSDQGKIGVLRYDKTCGNVSTADTKSNIGDTIFHHIVMIRDNGIIKLYFDNKLDTTEIDKSACLTSNFDDLFIGRKGGSWKSAYFKGAIDDIQIYNCALSEKVIDSLYTVASWVGVENTKMDDFSFKVYPNPSSGIVTIELNEEMQSYTVDVFDMTGKLVKTLHYSNKYVVQLDLPNQPGLYSIQIRDNLGWARSKVVSRK